MSEKDEDPPSETDKPVGYGVPPPASMFKPGGKGGPGRPKGSKNKPKQTELTAMEQLYLSEGRRIVKPEEKMSASGAVVRAQLKSAIQGKTIAQRHVIQTVMQLEEKERRQTDERLAACEAYVRLAQDYLERVSDQDRAAFEASLVPHPDDVDVDFVKREIIIRGPASSKEKRELDEFKAELKCLHNEILSCRDEIEADPTDRALQLRFTMINHSYLTFAEFLPARHRPPPLPLWEKASSIPWFSGEKVQRKMASNAQLSRKASSRSAVSRWLNKLDKIERLGRRWNTDL